MFHVVLVEPQIPPNTGNVIRLCANTGARLHLVQPLGFALDHARMRRAGLDYHEFAQMAVHASFEALLRSERPDLHRLFALTRHGSAHFAEVEFRSGDWFVFGSETTGLPAGVREHFPPARQLRLPMRPGNRSLNLSNAVAVVVFEAWRQSGFSGGV
ncbi:MAG TPA: tRNA (uridine(34)/cytosine(34)/5-carboxymethylaminomethyluridine(34)-2'-O)-methyltransferase TrmL [Burkholderiaceae bacterium]|jgi:tRNA (cytidine/uridine-2'-O-)-methyltransferase|nr:tRNA (uridine(34)/cytosine(34)/5-carboxymethylaminomethyluridine(34)-2'-O)-methyltransferase TrmL [Burkholderiaceae bacterium]